MVLVCGNCSLMARIPSIVSTALPTYFASPVPQGKTSGSKKMSSGATPYFSVRRVKLRRAISTLRCRVTPMPCSGSSSIVPTTSAAPYFWASGTTARKRSSPSSRLMEFRTDLP